MGDNVTTNPVPERRNPGDEARPGAPQTGEVACPICQGSGRDANQAPCANCGGTGMVVVIVGDA